MKPDPAGRPSAPTSLEIHREQLQTCLKELLQIDTLVCDSFPSFYEELPKGRHWEFADQFEEVTDRLDASIGLIEIWLACKPWKDKTEFAPVLKSIRRAGRCAREIAGEFENHEMAALTRLADVLKEVAKCHGEASNFGLAYAERLALGDRSAAAGAGLKMPTFEGRGFADLLLKK